MFLGMIIINQKPNNREGVEVIIDYQNAIAISHNRALLKYLCPAL